MAINAPRGTKDILETEVLKWNNLEEILRKICRDYNINEIRTPIFEYLELFQRGIGDTTDIVQKEMFVMEGSVEEGGKSYGLRPEGTAGSVRSYIENSLYGKPQPIKMFYLGPIFRKEKPQKGRMRQFHQFGVEVMGSYSPAADAEVISITYEIFKRLGIENISLQLNSLGEGDCRISYNNAFKDFVGENKSELCDTCKERFEKNPLRVLDCKERACKSVMSNAPKTIDHLDEDCKTHFETLLNILDSMEIPYEINHKLVRGLDYYTRTVFEFVSTDNTLGSQNTICGGGRYNNLIEECGGKSNGCVGFAIGMERLLIALEGINSPLVHELQLEPVDIYIGSIGDKGFTKAQSLVYELRKKGIRAEADILGRSVKAQMKFADKLNARYSVILGDDEIANNSCKLKNMETSEQNEVNFSDIEKLFNN